MLYLRLRLYSKNKGGYFNGFTFQHREKYHLLPQLRKLHLVQGNKVINHRRISQEFCMAEKEFFSTYFTKVPKDVLTSKSIFNAFLTVIVETYIRKGQDIKSKSGSRVWDHRSHCFVRKQEKKQGQGTLEKLSKKLSSTKFSGQTMSFISRSMIQRLRSVSSGTISAHRKKMSYLEYAIYYSIIKISDNPYGLNINCDSDLSPNMFFCKKMNKWIQYHPTACSSSITLSNNRRHYYWCNILSGGITGNIGSTPSISDLPSPSTAF